MKRLTGVNIIIIFMLLTLIPDAFSQKYPELNTRSGKAKKHYMEAMSAFNLQNYNSVISNINSAIEYDSLFVEAWLLIADVYSLQKKYNDAISAYRKALKINPEFFPNAWYLMAGNLQKSGKYKEAFDAYNSALLNNRYPPEKRKLVETKRGECGYAMDLVAHPVPFNPENLGDSINSTDEDYVNAITADDGRLYLTVKEKKYHAERDRWVEEEDFYVSVQNAGQWTAARNIGEPVNTPGNEGALCISADGMDMYFAGCNRPDGLGSCDIYHAVRLGDSWSVPENTGRRMNTPKWDTQPSIAADGRTLFFASNRPGGKGTADLYVAVKDEIGVWGEAVNLGDSINTSEMEVTPFIHPDGQSLYFASEGHPGLGGFDLFVSRKKPDGTWSKPRNLGYPINTEADEMNLIVNARGNMAYLSSAKLGGFGKHDVYRFELPEQVRPEPVSYFKGIVFNSVNRRPVEAAFELIDLLSGETVVHSHSEPVRGEFMVTLPSGRDYALHVSSPGYLFYSENFSIPDIRTTVEPVVYNIPLQPLQEGEEVVLRNVFFETDQYTLKPESRVELDRLVLLLKNNPKLRIEISGHTDDQGAEEYNMNLSANRARVVYEYLVSAAVEASRLAFKGYGETMPVASNTTEEGRKQNRRTTFRVLKDN